MRRQGLLLARLRAYIVGFKCLIKRGKSKNKINPKIQKVLN